MERPFDNFIWDWNGTLLDDLDQVLEAVAVPLKRFGLEMPSLQQYRSVFGFPVKDYYKRLGLPVDDETFESISRDFLASLESTLDQTRLFEGAKEFLMETRNLGARHYILSACPQGLLNLSIDRFELRSLFSGIYGLDHHRADSKLERGLELIRQEQLDPQRTMLVGDTLHDFEVSQALGVEVTIVASGHQDFDRLSHLPCRVLNRSFFCDRPNFFFS